MPTDVNFAPDAPLSPRTLGLLRDIPDFPQPGILFKDITPVLTDAQALHEVISVMSHSVQALEPDLIVGVESRGFIFGTPVAYELGLGFSPVRKVGKLPHTTIKLEYALEYGTSTVEMHTDAVVPKQRVVIVDDLLATGGTARAAASLVEQLGGVVVGFCFMVELGFLNGREKLPNYHVVSLATF